VNGKEHNDITAKTSDFRAKRNDTFQSSVYLTPNSSHGNLSKSKEQITQGGNYDSQKRLMENIQPNLKIEEGDQDSEIPSSAAPIAVEVLIEHDSTHK